MAVWLHLSLMTERLHSLRKDSMIGSPATRQDQIDRRKNEKSSDWLHCKKIELPTSFRQQFTFGDTAIYLKHSSILFLCAV
jgi:hypothetical protein